MINDDVLIKYSISHNFGGWGDWVSHVKYLKSQIKDIRDNDFTGIGEGDLSLISPQNVSPGKRIILCDYLDQNGGCQDNACILGLVTRLNPNNPLIIELEIEGIGARNDLIRDPGRLLKWGTKIYPDLSKYPCLLEMITKPKTDGGAVYYYYNKSPRDLRVNYVPGKPIESGMAILGALNNLVTEENLNTRPRAQYFHAYKKISREIKKLSEENKSWLIENINFLRKIGPKLKLKLPSIPPADL